MSPSSRKRQRPAAMAGQSLTEFLLCLLVWVPLLLAAYHLLQYGDLRFATLQASRYAAFQRAVQPDPDRLSSEAIAEAVRTRFFLPPDRQPGNARGELRSSDAVSPVAAGPEVPTVPLWRDLQGRPLLAHPRHVRLTFEAQALPSGPAGLTHLAHSAWGLPPSAIQVAQVEVPLRNLFGPGTAPVLLRASTAVLVDDWTAPGSAGVREALQSHAALRGARAGMEVVGPAVSWVVGLLEDTPPVLPCLRVEAVPADRLSGAPSSPGACQ